MNRDDEAVLRTTWNSFHDGMCEILKTAQDEAYGLGLKRGADRQESVEKERDKLSDALIQINHVCVATYPECSGTALAEMVRKLAAERDKYKATLQELLRADADYFNSPADSVDAALADDRLITARRQAWEALKP